MEDFFPPHIVSPTWWFFLYFSGRKNYSQAYFSSPQTLCFFRKCQGSIEKSHSKITNTSMKRSRLLGRIVVLSLCVATIPASVVSQPQMTPLQSTHTSDRSFGRGAQQIAVEWSAAMPQTTWSSHADVSWYTADGTEFTLTTAEQFAGLAKLVNSGKSMKGVTIKLGNDVDFSANRFDEVIGKDNDNPFSGTFDGGNHTITGVMISDPVLGFIGFFGQTNEAIIRNTIIRNATVVGSAPAGALVCNIYNKGLVSNCHAYDCRIVSAPYETSFGGSGAGSLVGGLLDESKIENCSATRVEVYSQSQSGAFISQAYNLCEVKNCFVTDSKIIADVGLIGGFVGINFAFFPGTESTFSNCYALNVEVVSLDSGDQAVLGGFVGQVSANFIAKHCYVSAKVTGGKNPGAFVGMTADESMNCKYDGCFYNNEQNPGMVGIGNGVEIPAIAGMPEAAMKTADMAAKLNADQNPAPWLQANDVNNGWPYLKDNKPVITSLAAPMSHEIRIWATAGRIFIAGAPVGTSVQVYDMQGHRIYNAAVLADHDIAVASGVYVVRAGDSTAKVIVL
ncbi:hypothetical protein Pgin01_01036 [Porphyromonas gingivalis]